ncbi:MAG: hypothetical protein HUJ72_00910 [Blautia sp.]|nr:hypothetical protein [Blautia sp.]
MRKNQDIVSTGIALLFSALFFALCMNVPALSQAIRSKGNINILVYAGTLVLFCCVFVACRAILSGKVLPVESTGFKAFTAFLLVAMQGVLLAISTALETKQSSGVAYKYSWHTQPFVFLLAAAILEVVIFIRLYRRLEGTAREKDWLIYCLYILLTVLVIYNMYTPNIFGRNYWSDSYHGYAYYNSIFNVYMGKPYTAELSSIYGHYALFWKIPMKLLGGDYFKFVFLLAVLTGIVHACAFFVLHCTVKSQLIRALGAIAITFPVLGMRGGYYWQLWPHRMVWAMIVLVYVVITFQKGCFRWPWTVLGYALGSLAILWNTETGLVLAIAYAAVHICRYLSDERYSLLQVFSAAMLHFAAIAAAFFGAYGMVNLYNRMAGGGANTIREFMIPLLSETFVTDTLQIDLLMIPSAYMFVMGLFLVGTAVGICSWRWFSPELTWKPRVIFFLSISALGRMVYYMNRAAYHNLECVFLSAVLLLAILAENGLQVLSLKKPGELLRQPFVKMVRGCAGVVSLIVILLLASGMVLQFGENSYIRENLHNRAEIEALVDSVRTHVPENTHAFGYEIPEIYSMLGWDPHYYTIDFCDMAQSRDSGVYLMEQIRKDAPPAVFTTDRSLGTLKHFSEESYNWFLENYEAGQEIPGFDFTFILYERK